MSKLYSTEKILVYVGNDKLQCEEMIDLFLQIIPQEFETLERKIANQNWDMAYEISHRIKPSMEILQIKNVSDEFSELHTKLHQKIDMESIPLLFNEILKDLNRALTQIKEDFNK